SAPGPRFGTFGLGGHPLRLFPWHRGFRFPGYRLEPTAESRHLNAGRHAGSKRIAPALLPEQRRNPGFDVISRSFDTSSVVHLRPSPRGPRARVVPCLFRECSRRGVWPQAASGGLDPAPAGRLRGAFPHLDPTWPGAPTPAPFSPPAPLSPVKVSASPHLG